MLIICFCCLGKLAEKVHAKDINCRELAQTYLIKANDRNIFSYPSYSTTITQTSHFEDSIYILSSSSSPSGSVISRLNLYTLDFDWSKFYNVDFQRFVITTDQQRLVTSYASTGLLGTIIFCTNDILEKDLQTYFCYTNTNFDISTSVIHMESKNSSHVYLYLTSTIYLSKLCTLDISGQSVEPLNCKRFYDGFYNLKKIVLARTVNKIIIMFELVGSNHLAFSEYDVSNETPSTRFGIDCLGGSTNCITEDDPQMLVNENTNTFYVLVKHGNNGLYFLSVKIGELNLSGSNSFEFKLTFSSIRSHDLALNNDNKEVWAVYEVSSTQLMFAKYNTESNTFDNPVYYSSSRYTKLHFTDISTVVLGSNGTNMTIGRVDFGLDEHTDFSTIYLSTGTSISVFIANAPIDYASNSSITLSTYGFLSITSISSSKNPRSDLQWGYDLVFIQNDDEVQKIRLAQTTTTDFCPPLSQNGAMSLDYTFYQISPTKSLGYNISVDSTTGNLKVQNSRSAEESLTSSEFYFIANSTNQNVRAVGYVKFEEENSEGGNPALANFLQKSTFIVGLIVSAVTSILGGSLIQGVWMVFNQQKLLLLFLLINAYIGEGVKFLISQQSFVMLDLDFMNNFLPDVFSTPFFIKGLLDTPQRSDRIKDVGFEWESGAGQYWKLFGCLFLLSMIHFLSFIIKSIWKFFTNGNQEIDFEGGSSQDEEEKEEHKQNSEQDKTKDLESGFEGLEFELENNEPGIEELTPELDQVEDEDSKERHNTTNVGFCQDISKSYEDYKYKHDNIMEESKDEHIGFEDDNGSDYESAGYSYSGEGEDDEDLSDPKQDPPNPKKPGKLKSLLSKIGKLFESKNFWSLYFRAMIESFMGVMIITLNEMKTNKLETGFQMISLALSVIIFIGYFLFYCFTWGICFCEFIERIEIAQKKAQRKLEREQDSDYEEGQSESTEEDEGKEEMFYEELLADLSKEPVAALHVPLVLTRIVVFTFLIIAFDVFTKDTVWMQFMALYIFQILYLYQTVMYPKFEWWPLNNIYRINEAFLCVFILLFALLRTADDYKGYSSTSIIVLLIFLNTSTVIFLQTCGGYIQAKKVIKEAIIYFKKKEKVEPEPEPAPASKPKRKKVKKDMRQCYFDVTNMTIMGETAQISSTTEEEIIEENSEHSENPPSKRKKRRKKANMSSKYEDILKYKDHKAYLSEQEKRKLKKAKTFERRKQKKVNKALKRMGNDIFKDQIPEVRNSFQESGRNTIKRHESGPTTLRTTTLGHLSHRHMTSMNIFPPLFQNGLKEETKNSDRL
ncbi:unnamed protein product [Moneuplotes crassus]|uniref:Uncharacterized protein n=1 Tax=Euplotes crassus TaxID=5936 RepID=A0AAD1XYR2_EUPCR|nr:unnamed protein product [Moneuplotes crassus]